MTLLLAILFTLIPALDACADIYRYVNDDGVECFTDTPANNNAALVMKEGNITPSRKTKHRVPAHLAATGIDAKTATQNTQIPRGMDSAQVFLPVQGQITSPVGIRRDPIDGTFREHRGVDIAVPGGTPIRPVAPGKVVFAGTRPGYGNLVIVEHADGTITLYAHNSINRAMEGTSVNKDTIIALSGSTGRSTGPHLHFEAWKDGANITSSYIQDRKAGGGETASQPPLPADSIRRIVQTDGTLLFTNLPLYHP